MHTALRGYKDRLEQRARDRFTRDLLAIFWRFVRGHERCIAEAVGTSGFDAVTTVPSKATARDEARGRLRAIVGEHCRPTTDRYVRVLRPVDGSHQARRFDPDRYRATQRLDGARVLLIDDTWTTGSSAQSAACVLRQAGARTVALIVLGRYLDFDFADHRQRFQDLPAGFDWATCVVDAGRGPTS
jgi:hypothetical protein